MSPELRYYFFTVDKFAFDHRGNRDIKTNTLDSKLDETEGALQRIELLDQGLIL